MHDSVSLFTWLWAKIKPSEKSLHTFESHVNVCACLCLCEREKEAPAVGCKGQQMAMSDTWLSFSCCFYINQHFSAAWHNDVLMKNDFTEQNSQKQDFTITTQSGTKVWAMPCKHTAPLYKRNMHFCIILAVTNLSTQGGDTHFWGKHCCGHQSIFLMLFSLHFRGSVKPLQFQGVAPFLTLQY